MKWRLSSVERIQPVLRQLLTAAAAIKRTIAAWLYYSPGEDRAVWKPCNGNGNRTLLSLGERIPTCLFYDSLSTEAQSQVIPFCYYSVSRSFNGVLTHNLFMKHQRVYR